MWSYYGAKTNIAHLYPPPKYGKIIEPFAGTARYSLQHFEKEVLLVDKYDVIINIWKFLKAASEKDIMSLPEIKAGQNINELNWDCEEQRNLVAFMIGFGFTSPRKTAIPRLRNRPNAFKYTRKRIASELFKIRHWNFRIGSYEEIENEECTWYIDPPYQFGGHAYVKSNKHIDFEKLKSWCMERKGQVMVCENTKATWMPFKPMVVQNVLTGAHSEAIWTNFETSCTVNQLDLFNNV